MSRVSTFDNLLTGWMKRRAGKLRTMWNVRGASAPGSLRTYWRHRAALKRLSRSLFYHRYATAVLLANELGVFDALAKGPASIAQVAEACGTKLKAAEALLRILNSQELVKLRGGRAELSQFANTYLTRPSPHSISSLIDLMAGQAMAFAELPDSMRTGLVPPTLDIFGTSGRYRAFLDAVNSHLNIATPDLLSRVDFPELETAIVGSMGVSFSAHLLQRFPNLSVTYGCLEHLVREIPQLREKYGVDARRVVGTHAHGGDPSADRWGDESFDLVLLTKKMILAPEDHIGEKFAAKAFEVLRPGGVAVFWEAVHENDGPTPLPRAMEAMLDLASSPLGAANTVEDMRRLLNQIGFAKIELVHCLNGQTTFVIARKLR